MQDKLRQNKKLKPRCLSCSFFIRHFWFLDTRKDNDTDRKLGFALLIDLEWKSIDYNKNNIFQRRELDFLPEQQGKRGHFLARWTF